MLDMAVSYVSCVLSSFVLPASRCLRQLEFRLRRGKGALVGRVLVKRVCGVECLSLGPERVLKYA
jgi:hypothetical protein